MGSKKTISVKQFLEIFQLYDSGHGTMKECIKIAGYSFDRSYIFSKYHTYKIHGIQALEPQKRPRYYSESFKLKVVKAYLNGEGSYRSLALKYNIKSFDTIRKWVNRYTDGKALKVYFPKLEVYKMDIKKMTQEDRVKIAKECIRIDLNYKETAEKYGLSYHQEYRWVKEYEKHGEAGLIDGRGKGRPSQAMTTEEKLKAQIKALEERNKYLEMEIDVLKKLEEIERRSVIQELDKKHRT